MRNKDGGRCEICVSWIELWDLVSAIVFRCGKKENEKKREETDRCKKASSIRANYNFISVSLWRLQPRMVIYFIVGNGVVRWLRNARSSRFCRDVSVSGVIAPSFGGRKYRTKSAAIYPVRDFNWILNVQRTLWTQLVVMMWANCNEGYISREPWRSSTL